MRYIILVLLSWLPPAGLAEVYKTVDEDGNVIYTDNPRAVEGKKPEPVELPTINTQPPPTFTAKPPAPGATSEKGAPARYQLKITSPQDGDFVPPGQRDVTVTAALEPALSPEHRLEVLLNGQAVAREAATSITLKEIFRGSHKVQVRVVDQKGKAISTSAPITIHVRRVSVAKPAAKKR